MMGKALLIAGAVIVASLIHMATRGGDHVMRATFQAQDQRVECVGRGVGYFKEIGSWPTLSDGQDAFTVATRRCERTVAAF